MESPKDSSSPSVPKIILFNLVLAVIFPPLFTVFFMGIGWAGVAFNFALKAWGIR